MDLASLIAKRKELDRLEREVLEHLGNSDYAGISPAGFRLLATLAASGEPASGLARRLGFSKQSVWETIDTLEARGYVSTLTHEKDRRMRMVSLTPRGHLARRLADRYLAAKTAAAESVE
jgi:DNA-binding MarR family transcriptional regulator